MKTKTITIEGMSCNNCVTHVRKELAKVSNVKDVRIGTAIVEIDENSTTAADLIQAVDIAGYNATSID